MIRDLFLDSQYRTENSKFGYWDTKAGSLERMESLVNEPSEQGLSEVMNSFWQSLNDLAVNPDNTGARSAVAQNALAVAESFNYLAKNLKSIQADLKDKISALAQESDSGQESEINLLLSEINSINQQVQKIEPHGFVANDLYDKRDALIDHLSSLVNINVERHKVSNGKEMADGLVSIELTKEMGESYDPPLFLIEAPSEERLQEDAVNEIYIDFNDNGKVNKVTVGSDDSTDIKDFLKSSGSLAALIETNGYEGD